ncbi:MAG: alanine racemase [Hyphomicrobiaceae bacterium]|nr:alanine racemase [Hyphomicrobiaceae bacterium]
MLDFLNLEPEGSTIDDLDTPVPIIDIDVVDRNVRRWQTQCDRRGLANRPHFKTHKLAGLARYQLAAGAKGMTVQKLGEAEVLARAGIKDMLLTFNIVGEAKLVRLAALARSTDIRVVADNAQVVEGIGRAGAMAGREITVLVECDTGGGRNGVQTPSEAAALAQVIAAAPGARFGGLMTYPKPRTREVTRDFFSMARNLIEAVGLETEIVSTGGSVDLWDYSGLDLATEYRAGTYIYGDRYLVAHDACSRQDCALHVLSTIVSRPISDRAIIDAGSKALTSDLLGLTGYGIVPDLNDALVSQISEEHAIIDASETVKIDIGARVRVLPNHVCPVSNLFDRVVFVRGRTVLGSTRVDGRGKVT